MKFIVPDPGKFRVSDCGMYLIEKRVTPQKEDFRGNPQTPKVEYIGWEFKRIMGNWKSAEEAVAGIVNREVDHLQTEREFFEGQQLSKPDTSGRQS